MSGDVRPRIAVVGLGRLGSVLGVALHRAGFPVVSCWSRNVDSAVRATNLISGCHLASSPQDAAVGADLVFLSVPDGAIASVDAAICWEARQTAVHCSGALPAAVMATAMKSGARVAGFHPLQTFADLETGLRNLPGSTIGIEAVDHTWEVLRAVAAALGAQPLRLRTEDRATYHLASVVVSNFTVGLMALASDLWDGIGMERTQAARALLPLLAGTVTNIETLGAPSALTGPIVRGDVGTIASHRKALRDMPEAMAIYDSISRFLVGVARDQGSIAPAAASEILATLKVAATRSGKSQR